MIEFINAERTKNGVSKLTMVSQLNDVASLRAEEITVDFSHTRPDGASCSTVFDEKGLDFLWFGENIAYTPISFSDPAGQVVEAWMNSEGHRKNILSTNFTSVGVGVNISSNRYYWSMEFAGGLSLPAYTFGDVDNDRKVDSNDASLILTEYSRLSTSNTGDFTENMRKSADVNIDGKIDSVDASLILSYYSYTSTGGIYTIEKFLNLN